MAKWPLTLAELAQTRGPALQRYGFLLCGNRSDASDLVQEALVRVLARPRLSWDVASVEGYVRRTMLNHFLDLRRRSKRASGLAARVEQPSPAVDTSGEVVHKLDLLSALDLLSPRQRACVVLRYYEDQTVAGISGLLGCSEGTVKRHLHEALSRLGTSLEPSYNETGGETK